MTLKDGLGAETKVSLSARDTTGVLIFAVSVVVTLLSMAVTGAWFTARMHARVEALEVTADRALKDSAIAAESLGTIKTDLAVIREKIEGLTRPGGR
jgi:cell division septal protein FtsQ